MDDEDLLARRFEDDRTHLRAVALRMLGSADEAEAAVHEAWLRLRRSDPSVVDLLGGWLTTVVASVALDMLRARSTPRGPLLDEPSTPDASAAAAAEDEGVLADSVGLALLIVLDSLNPAERLAFVLHDMFAVDFEDIAPIVDRSPAAARQLADRARRRIRGQQPTPDPGLARRRLVVDAFLAASRGGDFEALLTLLDPDVVLRADAAAVRSGAEAESRGVAAIAGAFLGRAQFARTALVDGEVGAVWQVGGKPRVVFGFAITGGRITAIDLFAEPEHLRRLAIDVLDVA